MNELYAFIFRRQHNKIKGRRKPFWDNIRIALLIFGLNSPGKFHSGGWNRYLLRPEKLSNAHCCSFEQRIVEVEGLLSLLSRQNFDDSEAVNDRSLWHRDHRAPNEQRRFFRTAYYFFAVIGLQ